MVAAMPLQDVQNLLIAGRPIAPCLPDLVAAEVYEPARRLMHCRPSSAPCRPDRSSLFTRRLSTLFHATAEQARAGHDARAVPHSQIAHTRIRDEATLGTHASHRTLLSRRHGI